MPVQVIVIAFVVIAAVVLVRAVVTWRKQSGPRAITCPQNQNPAGVRINARHAVSTGLLKTPELRISACSRWPERAGCGQECLSQIASAPDGCLVRNILLNWYKGKVCASCGQTFTDIEWSRKPALLTVGDSSLDWEQVSADRLYEVLAASAPLCFACHMANKLVHEHPELVVDRSAHSHLG
jgi:hypothetical protein